VRRGAHLGRSRWRIDPLARVDLPRVEQVVLVLENSLMQLVVEWLRLAKLCGRATWEGEPAG